jgi:hypothetical protein
LFHLAGELFKMMAGLDMVNVVYRGNVFAMTDLLGGQVQVSFAGSSRAIEHFKAGQLRALAVSTATRDEGAIGRARRHGAGGIARRLRQAHRQRHGKVGEGDPGGHIKAE